VGAFKDIPGVLRKRTVWCLHCLSRSCRSKAWR